LYFYAEAVKNFASTANSTTFGEHNSRTVVKHCWFLMPWSSGPTQNYAPKLSLRTTSASSSLATTTQRSRTR